MSAKVILFQRDLHAEIAKLTTFDSQPTVDDLLHRHDRIGQILDEAWRLEEKELVEPRYLDCITHAYFEMHSIALRAGVHEKIVDEFNKRREDWKSWAAEWKKKYGRPWA